MKTRYVLCLTAFAAALAAGTPIVAEGAQAPPPPGGMLRTKPHGTDQCAPPGGAAGEAYVVVEEEGFSIGTASSYTNSEGRGVYILRGDDLTFTRGPKKGERFERIGTNQLRRVEADGSQGKLLCTRLGGSG